MFNRLTPQATFTLAGIVALGGICLSVWLALQSPWFGIELDQSPESVGVILSVSDRAKAAGLKPGDRVIAFAAPGQEPVKLYPLSLVNDPDHTGSFQGLRELVANVESLFAATSGHVTELHLADGRIITLEKTPRSISSLPPMWWIMAAGALPFIVSAGVWSYRRRDIVSRLLLLAGASFMGIALNNLVYSYRQPSIDPHIFEIAMYGNRLSALLFFFSNIAIFWIYPKRLGSIRVVATGFLVFALLFVNELTQMVNWPGDPFVFPLVVSFPISLVLVAIQLHLARKNPVDYAALQSFVLSMTTGTIIVTSLYFLPPLIDAQPVISNEVAYAVGVIGSLGLIMAVARYRLFELGAWWLTAWMWLIGGTAVVGLDLVTAYLLNVSPDTVIAISVFLVGWIYFPMRQWLWRRLFWNSKDPMEWLPEALLECIVISPNANTLTANWYALLNKLFHPLEIKRLTEVVTVPEIGEDGLTLRVPDLGGSHGVELAYRSDGRRLFATADCELISSLLQMAGPAVNAQTAREVATRRERERIMRDLHDDVCSRLLTLSHRMEQGENAEMVQSAMQSLRETIYSLNQPEGIELETALAEWRYEIMERLEIVDIGLRWSVEELPPGIQLSAAQRTNLGHVMREAVSNAIRHATPESLSVEVRLSDKHLHVVICNDGMVAAPGSWGAGSGMMNMRRRMQELDGKVVWHYDDEVRSCCVKLELPVDGLGLYSTVTPLKPVESTSVKELKDAS